MISLMFMDNLILCYHFRLHDLVEQRLCLFQIERVEAFGDPAVDRSEKIAGLIRLALSGDSHAPPVCLRSSLRPTSTAT